jgi:hypothetical protein
VIVGLPSKGQRHERASNRYRVSMDNVAGRDQWLASGTETAVEQGYAKLDALVGEIQ